MMRLDSIKSGYATAVRRASGVVAKVGMALQAVPFVSGGLHRADERHADNQGRLGELSLPWVTSGFAAFAICACWFNSPVRAANAPAPEVAPAAASALAAKVGFDQKLGATVPLDAVFRDENAQPISLAHLLDGRRPAVLVLGYKDCPMLCSMVLGGLTETLTQMRASTGKDFDLIDVSIDPKQSPQDAAAQKRLYYKRYARPGADAGWHFLTSPDDATIHRLADAVGFRYAYEESTHQYAHPSGVVVLTPAGKVSRYFFGVNYEAKDLQAAITAAGTNRVGSPIEQLLLLCFHFNPATSKHGALIINGLRAAGVLTVLVLFGGLAFLIRGERLTPSSASIHPRP